MKVKQRDLFEVKREFAPRRRTHGGRDGAGKRKLARPLDPRLPVHLVLKSSHARGRLSLLGARNQVLVASLVKQWAARFKVRVHGFENMGNHLHIVASFAKRDHFKDFLRTICALIARAVTGARRGHAFGKRFWDHLAFTRVVTGHRDPRGLGRYLRKNAMERENSSFVREVIAVYESEIQGATTENSTTRSQRKESSA